MFFSEKKRRMSEINCNFAENIRIIYICNYEKNIIDNGLGGICDKCLCPGKDHEMV